jgi:hypothetical protein
MPTKFILHGGYASQPNPDNDTFFTEILKGTGDNPKVLLVFFSIPPELIPEKREKDMHQFEKNSGGKHVTFETADESDFIDQIKNADIVYLRGGKTSQLLEKLRMYPDFPEAIKDKIVAGESAGAYALSTVFYSKTEGGIFEGLGLVPTKTICHYVGENNDKLPDTQGLELLLLPDFKFKVIYI